MGEALKQDKEHSKNTSEIPEQQKSTERPSPEEIGGPQGPEPTRYGDWERKGRCIDF